MRRHFLTATFPLVPWELQGAELERAWKQAAGHCLSHGRHGCGVSLAAVQFLQQFHFWWCLKEDSGPETSPKIQQVVPDQPKWAAGVRLSE